jgi:hypothetical protein
MEDEAVPPDVVPLEALKAIERVIWRAGITGDRCGLVAAGVLEALSTAGFQVVESTRP